MTARSLPKMHIVTYMIFCIEEATDVKGRSNRGRAERPKVQSRVFVTHGTPSRSPGGVYTLSGRPLSLPPEGSAKPVPFPGELDDWVPEPESYLPQDEAFDEFEVSSGASALPDPPDPYVDEVAPWTDVPVPDVDGGSAVGIEHPGAPVMAPISPSRAQPFIGEEIPQPVPVRIASSTGVRWKKK